MSKSKKTTLILHLSVWMLFLLGSAGKAQDNPGGQRMLDLFHATENGQTLIMLNYRDSVLYPLYESRKELTDVYAKFWQNENFMALRDLNVDIKPDAVYKTGIVIVLEMRQKVGLKDPGFDMHQRLGRMLINYCRNKAGQNASIIWKVAVDTTYGDENIRRSDISTIFGTRHKTILQEPSAKDSAKVVQINEKGNRNIAMPAIEMAALLASGTADQFQKMYAPLLAFDGFKYGTDATVGFQRNPIDQNSLLILFKIGRRVARTDPELTMHKNLAEQMVKKLNDDLMPFAPAWLDFKAAADTTGGRDPYVLLVTYTR